MANRILVGIFIPLIYACTSIGFTPAASAEENYVLKSGVTLTKEVRAKVKKIADEYHKQTGKNITVASGTRTPASQAKAMYEKLEDGDDLKIYKDQISAQAIKKAYDEGKEKNLKRVAIEKEMTRVISEQIKAGKYISKHLRAGAVDIRSRDMSASEKKAFRTAAKQTVKSVLLETTPPHWHLQF
ncbi:hypothetical protein [Roseiconus lacunae]|uniref:DUF541 domain-containing protein n=1 Tax=Roseiconus lacunae TaxID=2605694 RepID=A0ABT7PP00_9BACT|nr:hypothetical protein [Roseiconus lacunae]MDM4018213.1 hypothetical protein [Roseiconus lacunae]